MSFPVLIIAAEEAPLSQLPAEHSSDERPIGVLAPAPSTEVRCPACDGSGLWRGIDGFLFLCRHCCFEMT